ncbi:PqiA/YebS family transporter subunit [Shewanella mangrovisoli]|uniref:PqiA/YebS family transporter subunit n=1 Tax=Shewanella mangrovisoli TaxID=2864211 RepID=UPI0035BA0D61
MSQNIYSRHDGVLQACEECGLVTPYTEPQPGYRAHCPRCQHGLQSVLATPFQPVWAYGAATLIMLGLSLGFPFLSFSVQGLSQEASLWSALISMHYASNSLLALVILLCVVILPLMYISFSMLIYRQAYLVQQGKTIELSWLKRASKWVFRFESWLMADVFLVGILVAMVKILSLAEVGFGPSFWAFCIYTLLLVKFVSLVDSSWVWDKLTPRVATPYVRVGESHLQQNHGVCSICGQLNAIDATECSRCAGAVHKYLPANSMQAAWAFLLAATVFYIPANFYPIMYTTSVGQTEASTIISGVVLLWHLGSYPVASIIFFASIVIPTAKIASLAYLFRQAGKAHSSDQAIKNQQLYRVTEFIGRWSMIDIFVVALLTALVQLDELMAIKPGPAALSFAMVVILTMLSAIAFDSRVLWRQSSTNNCEK